MKGPQLVLRTKRARKSCSERLASCSSRGVRLCGKTHRARRGPSRCVPGTPTHSSCLSLVGPTMPSKLTQNQPLLFQLRGHQRPGRCGHQWTRQEQGCLGPGPASSLRLPWQVTQGQTEPLGRLEPRQRGGGLRVGPRAVGELLPGQRGWAILEARGPPFCPQGSPAPQGAWGWPVLREPQPAERPCFWVSIQAGTGTQTPGVESGEGLG